ncbi:YihY/virulence factor BrkB family protein [Skermanella pratensis]|uniref:YihY/virulence factor BrkB family protein n=1 Tax=Skermanella pratensis TaxID=2233999 RepID=UPI00130197FD|nr:YihY/virulence factor BrkB family protein [Skermanella pratensis]
MPFGKAWQVLVTAFNGWLEDRAASMGAAIAFYTLFSLAPMLLLIIAIAGLVFGPEAAQGALMGQLEGMMGREGAAALQAMIASAGKPVSGTIATVVALVTLIVGATTVFAELQSSLNVIWKADPPPGSSVVWLVKVRLLSLSLIGAIGFLLLVSLVVSATLTALSDYLAGIMPGLDLMMQATNLVISLAVVTTLFAMIYKMLPDTRIPWRDVWFGSFITAVMFSIGKLLISLYLGSSNIASAYGAAGALVIVLMWVYYSAQIFLFGAEITWAFSLTHGSRARGHAQPAAEGRAG